jgi:hypothetical protein
MRVAEKIKTRFILNFFPPKIVTFTRESGKIDGAGQATGDNTAHALCMLDT